MSNSGFIKNNVTQALEDAPYLTRIKKGDRDAFEFIYRKYFPGLYTLAMRYIKNSQDAEDILQQVFLKFWQIRGSLNPSANARGYLYSMLKNSVMNFIRDKNSLLQRHYSMSQSINNEEMDLWVQAEAKEMIGEMLLISFPHNKRELLYYDVRG